MSFNSYIFILLFLPLTIAGYHILNYAKKFQLALFFLLVMSLWFYGYTNPYYLIFLGGSIIINFTFHLLLTGTSGKDYFSKPISRKVLLCISLIINLGILFYFKYYNFFVDNMNLFFQTNLSIRNLLIPLGISFITFQQIAFCIDSYRNEIYKLHFSHYALFISFFPHALSGPILMQEDFLPQLSQQNRKKIDWTNFSIGIYMFVMGLGKKVLIADLFGNAVNIGYANLSSLNSTSTLFITLAYTLQIYFDFSGYSDMAVGLAKLLNFDIPLNFNSPYKSITIIDFWERWHITLTRFLTKYLYIPLGGNRKGTRRTYINTLIVFLLSGLWHGASWAFILWGLLHGLFLVVTKAFKTIFDRTPKILNWMVTFLFINITWILFRTESLGGTLLVIKAIAQSDWGKIDSGISDVFSSDFIRFIPEYIVPFMFLAIILLVVLTCNNVYESAVKAKYNFFRGALVITVLLLSILSLSGISTFLYMNF